MANEVVAAGVGEGEAGDPAGDQADGEGGEAAEEDRAGVLAAHLPALVHQLAQHQQQSAEPAQHTEVICLRHHLTI